MKALTIKQPWAWAIAAGHKPVENRTWITRYRGPLAIHVAAKWADPTVDAVRTVRDLARSQGAVIPERIADDLPLAGTRAVIAVVDLVDICTAMLHDPDGSVSTCECGPWAMAGHSHWKLANVRALAEPVPMTGRLGLWDWAEDEVRS